MLLSFASSAQSVINTFPYTEDFESWTLCSETCTVACVLPTAWLNAGGIDFRPDTNGTPTGGTGPSIDHTLGTSSGVYCYVESSSPCNPDTAIFETPLVDLNNVQAPGFSFWYHQLTAVSIPDTFDVFISTDSGATYNLLFTGPNTTNSNTWMFDSVGLGAYLGNVIKIQIHWKTANAFNDFAIDDITFHGIQVINAGVDSIFSSNGFCIGDSTDLCVNIENTGLLDIDSVQVYMTINGDTFNGANPYIFQNGIIEDGEDSVICLGNAWLNTGDTIIAYTTMPNGLNDTFNVNDTFMLVVTMNPIPDADAGVDTTVCGYVPVNMGGNPTSSTASTFSWSPGTYLNNTALANPTATFTASGTFDYGVTVTDSNNCSNLDSVSVTVLPITSIDAGPDTTICSGDSVTIGGSPSAPASASVLWSNGNLLDDDTLQNPTATSTISTDFVLAATDTNNCTFYDTTFIFILLTPALDAGPDTGTCNNDSVQIGGSPTALNFASIAWAPAAGLSDSTVANPMASPPSDTVYTITLVDTFGCTFVDSVAVSVYTSPTIDAGDDTTVCAYAAFNAGGAPTGPAVATFAWTPSGLFNDTTLANPSVTVLSDTTIYVLVTDTVSGCQSLDSSAITILTIPSLDMGGDTFTICELDTMTIGGSPTAASGSTLDWTPGSYLDDSTAFNPLLTGTVTGFLHLEITDSASGCTNFDSALVVVNILPNIDAGPDTSVCLNDTIQIGGSPTSTQGGVQYTWGPGLILNDSTVANPNAFPTQDTTMYLTVTSAVGCNSYDTVQLTVDSLPVPVVTPHTQVCLGQSTQLQVGGGVSYAWDFGQYLDDDSISNPVATPPSNTLFTVTVTDGNGCQDTAQINVFFYPLPNVDAGTNDTICDGGSDTLTASGAMNYVWSPTGSLSSSNTATTVASPNSTTLYYVTGTDGNNCSVVDSVTVFVNVLPPVDAGNDTEVCIDDSVQIGGSPTGPGGSSYSWQATYVNNPTQANPYFDATGLNAGTYNVEVEVTDGNGCVTTDDLDITVKDLPTPFITPITNTICIGETYALNATGGVSFVWSPAGTLSSINISNPIAYPTVTTIYTVTVTSSSGCTKTESITLPVFPLTVADAGDDTAACQQDTIQLNATGGTQYQWSFSPYLSNTNTANPRCTAVVSGTYTVTVTDINGCTDVDEVQIDVNPLPTVSAGPAVSVCIGDSVSIGGSPTGPANSQFSWSPTTAMSDASAANPNVAPDSDIDYTVVVTSEFGCVDEASVSVVVDPLPSVSVVQAPVAVCRGDSVPLEVTPGYKTYTWTPGDDITDSTSYSVQVYPHKDRLYTLNVSDVKGCDTTLQFPISIWQPPIAEAGEDLDMCALDTIELKAQGGALYEWSHASFVEDSVSRITRAYPESTTRFVITVTDTNGCQDTDYVDITVFPLPEVDAGEDIDNCDIDVVYLGGSPTGPETAVFYWTPQVGLSDPYDPNPMLLDVERLTYSVEVQDTNGCINRDSLLVNADCFALIYAPTAFTPGSNDINDEFKIKYYRITEPELRIYDRLGHLVFETKDLDQGWDGSYRSGDGEAPSGVYYWVLAYKSEELRKMSKEGTVTLLR